MMSKALFLMLALAGADPLAQAQDAAAGRKKAAMCIGCHGIPGYQATFPEVYKVPMLGGQSPKYLAGALVAYKKGERKHPTMRAIAASLSDTDMADLAAFYESQGALSIKPAGAEPAVRPSAEVAALLSKGACASCHGANLSQPIDPSYPKLAGQPASYLAATLRAYASEGSLYLGRSNAIMAGQVKPFKPDELKALAQYIASLPSQLSTVPESRFR